MSTIIKIILAKIIVLLLSAILVPKSISTNFSDYSTCEVPLLGVKFHLMGRALPDLQIEEKIQENLSLLNQEYEDALRFELIAIEDCGNRGFLPDLHKDYFETQEKVVDSLVLGIESEGFVNVYIFDTYLSPGFSHELMGFTPVFKNSFENYQQLAPKYDRIFISYSALDKQTTLIHEMGHFLGLDHPWELDQDGKARMGLYSSDAIEVNHMSYGDKVASFTEEQLERMQNFAKNYRNYLFRCKNYTFGAQNLATVD